MQTKLKKSGKIITISLIFVLSFIMITSTSANVNAPLFTSTNRLALVDSEMDSADFIYYESNKTIHTDIYYSRYFNSILKKDVDMYNMSYFGNETIEEIQCPFAYSRESFADAIVSTVRHDLPPVQNGNWGKASLEICHALLKSAETGSPVDLHFQ